MKKRDASCLSNIFFFILGVIATIFVFVNFQEKLGLVDDSKIEEIKKIELKNEDNIKNMKKSVENLKSQGNDLKSKINTDEAVEMAKDAVSKVNIDGISADKINISIDTKAVKDDVSKNLTKAKNDTDKYLKDNYPDQVRLAEEIEVNSKKLWKNELKYIEELIEKIKQSFSK